MIVVFIAILAIVFFEVVRAEAYPLVRSEEDIQIKLLQDTPLGTPMEDVVEHIEKQKKWKVNSISYDGGFVDQREHPSQIVGEKSIRLLMGEYRTYSNLYLLMSVTVYYGFNKESELIDIWVWKTLDSL